MSVEAEGHLKRLACQIYTQLPEDKRDALLVMRYVRQILFCLGADWDAAFHKGAILPFETGPKGRAEAPTVLRVVPSDRPDTANRE